MNRRTFLAGGVAAGTFTKLGFSEERLTGLGQLSSASPTEQVEFNAAVDGRYSPLAFQATICYPDDPLKSLVGERGDLRYDFPRHLSAGVHEFGTVVEFMLAGMHLGDLRRQWLESPEVPIVHTVIEYPAASLELVTFATRRANEGRVDNVLMEVRPRGKRVNVIPLIRIRSGEEYGLGKRQGAVTEVLRQDRTLPWMYCRSFDAHDGELQWRREEGGFRLNLEHGVADENAPARYFFRLPQEETATAPDRTISPEQLLQEARLWWKQWRPYGGSVNWELPEKYGEFLKACARNIQQAREVKNKRLVFEVGPTVYRGMWIADGNFILEAARYLGYEKDADQGLLAEWNNQLPTGQIVAGSGGEHWKDTAIAMFTLVRACELKQDWTLLRQLAGNVQQAIQFLIGIRDKGRTGNSQNGRYGLLPPGFADGGIAGTHSEFTNTVWTLAGLKAIVQANQQLDLPELRKSAQFYRELRTSFDRAAEREMVRDPRGFTYLPMLAHNDPDFNAPDPWQRPRPQTAQWALSHAIFPGTVFAHDDPVVRGHIALMQACTQEDIPAETGWLHHEAVWTYNAAFVAEVYLWAGLRQWAHRTFTGFLNHASPLYVWREEQPLQTALVGDYWGDMPHNWASAECVRYLRHALVLEDGPSLRLLDGLLPKDFSRREAFSIQNTPTRFGRITLEVEPAESRGWRMRFSRDGGSNPSLVKLPRELLPDVSMAKVESASYTWSADGSILVDPAVRKWSAIWK